MGSQRPRGETCTVRAAGTRQDTVKGQLGGQCEQRCREGQAQGGPWGHGVHPTAPAPIWGHSALHSLSTDTCARVSPDSESKSPRTKPEPQRGLQNDTARPLRRLRTRSWCRGRAEGPSVRLASLGTDPQPRWTPRPWSSVPFPEPQVPRHPPPRAGTRRRGRSHTWQLSGASHPGPSHAEPALDLAAGCHLGPQAPPATLALTPATPLRPLMDPRSSWFCPSSPDLDLMPEGPSPLGNLVHRGHRAGQPQKPGEPPRDKEQGRHSHSGLH